MTHPGEPESYIRSSRHVQIGDEAGIAPSSIIERGDPFTLWIDFELLVREVRVLAGFLQFTVRYWLEGVGNPPADQNLTPKSGWTVRGQHRYSRPETGLLVPANTVPAGLYRPGAVVTFLLGCKSEEHRVRYPLTAYAEGRALEIFEAD